LDLIIYSMYVMNKAHNTIINNIGIPIQSNKFKINGHTIHYIKAGSGTPVVLVHGVNIGWGQWYKNIKALSKAFTVYAIDLPGSGKSSSIDFLHADLYRDFIDVLGKFVTIIVKKEPHIIAHSIGAWVVLKAYLNKQDEYLVENAPKLLVENQFFNRKHEYKHKYICEDKKILSLLKIDNSIIKTNIM